MGKPNAAPIPVQQPIAQTQATASTTKPASGPATPVVAKGKAASVEIPEGWGDTVHETKWTPPEDNLFGATSKEGPDGHPTETPFVAETVVEGEPSKPVDETEDEAELPAGDETETPLTEGEHGETDVKDKADEPVAVAPPVESNALIRRKALEALRIEGENRKLQQRLQDEQTARAADKAAHDVAVSAERARFDGLRKLPLEERARAMGFESKEALTEAIIRGEVPDFKPIEVAPVVDNTRVERMEAELNMMRIESRLSKVLAEQRSSVGVETIMAEAARTLGRPITNLTQDAVDHINQALNNVISGERTTGAAVQGIKAELDNLEANPAPHVRATKGALDAVTTSALSLWRGAGSKPGEFSKWAKFALESAEEMYVEQYKPIAALYGGTAMVPAGKPKATTSAARPSPPIGKRVAARAPVDDDDGPSDPKLRDRWIKEGNRKAGRPGWE